MVCPINARKRQHVRQLVVDRYGSTCFYCQKPISVDAEDQAARLTVDHLRPRSKGGRNILGNLRPACVPCNHEKGDDDPDPWLARRRLTRLFRPPPPLPHAALALIRASANAVNVGPAGAVGADGAGVGDCG